MSTTSNSGKRFEIDQDVVNGIGERFRDHAEQLRPHAEKLQDVELAPAYGPWAEAARPLEGQVQKIGKGLGDWARYCGGYGDALRASVRHYRGQDDDQGQRLEHIDVPDGKL
ncbi:MAG: hypothetical protein ACRC20_05865 [Segniliparus sp.]|uniref:hypothetical protein n=1 Tax=Segniliparus sp. TaxID=2804064 RepID=UPI003F3D8E73